MKAGSSGTVLFVSSHSRDCANHQNIKKVFTSAKYHASTTTMRTGVSLTSPWPWRPLPSPKLKDAVMEERVIFARPLAFSPRGHLVLGCTLGCFSIMYFLMPNKPKMPDFWSDRDDIGLFKKTVGTVQNAVFVVAPSVLGLCGSALAMYRVFIQTGRRVTRLSQVRVRNNDRQTGNVKPEMNLRIQTGRQDMWGMLVKPREVPLEDVLVESVPSRAGKGFLALSLRPEIIKYKIIERRTYYMDFRNSKALSGTGEVIMSLNRVEHVFGKIKEARL
ncbi:uncharacterized protein L203_100356 [Cryptococcus depauperatus CBS 7841]|uniref:Uncharacterized protein n=1 Tax=Cryptococcus depauperatus CBS 7841 TaxID=1295531 RepID=A0AAJ8JMX8_9TREE